jgi:hypothetical protein
VTARRADHDPPLRTAKMAGYAFDFNPPEFLSWRHTHAIRSDRLYQQMIQFA